MKDYDYSNEGAYFVTICVHDREYVFGNVIGGKMKLNEYGEIVNQCWFDLVNHYKNIELDYFIVMPNHVHGIINIVGAGLKPAPTTTGHGLPEIIRALKTFSARTINQLRKTKGQKFWQRNYYEHIIRDENDLFRIREYIQNNPIKWEEDKYYIKGENMVSEVQELINLKQKKKKKLENQQEFF